MKQKIALLLTGLLVGGLMMTVLPVGAHHQPAQRRLAQKVNRLQNRLNALTTKVNNRTQLLNRFGDYIGFVEGQQVLSLCAAESTATWQDTGATLGLGGPPISWIDTCLENLPQSTQHEPSTRPLQRTFGR